MTERDNKKEKYDEVVPVLLADAKTEVVVPKALVEELRQIVHEQKVWSNNIPLQKEYARFEQTLDATLSGKEGSTK